MASLHINESGSFKEYQLIEEGEVIARVTFNKFAEPIPKKLEEWKTSAIERHRLKKLKQDLLIS